MQSTRRIPEDSAYVLAFRGNQMSIPTYGIGLQGFQLPPQGGAYQFQDERIVIGNSANPLEVKEIGENQMILAQSVNSPEEGIVEYEETFERVQPYDVARMMRARNEPIPPELMNGGGQYGNGGPGGQYGGPNGMPPGGNMMPPGGNMMPPGGNMMPPGGNMMPPGGGRPGPGGVTGMPATNGGAYPPGMNGGNRGPILGPNGGNRMQGPPMNGNGMAPGAIGGNRGQVIPPQNRQQLPPPNRGSMNAPPNGVPNGNQQVPPQQQGGNGNQPEFDPGESALSNGVGL